MPDCFGILFEKHWKQSIQELYVLVVPMFIVRSFRRYILLATGIHYFQRRKRRVVVWSVISKVVMLCYLCKNYENMDFCIAIMSYLYTFYNIWHLKVDDKWAFFNKFAVLYCTEFPLIAKQYYFWVMHWPFTFYYFIYL